MTGIAECAAFFAGMIGVADAGVLADHASLSDEDSIKSYKMNSSGKNYAIAEYDFAVAMGLHILIGVDEQAFAAADVSGAMDVCPSQDHSACRQWKCEPRL